MKKDKQIGRTMKELGDWRMRPGEEDWVLTEIFEDGSRRFNLPDGSSALAREDGSRGYFDLTDNISVEDCSFIQEGAACSDSKFFPKLDARTTKKIKLQWEDAIKNSKRMYVTPIVEEADDINHPARYGGDSVYEAVKVIIAWGLNFCLGNVMKYICRAGKKDGETRLKSLKKAQWYLNREVEALEKEKADLLDAVLNAKDEKVPHAKYRP